MSDGVEDFDTLQINLGYIGSPAGFLLLLVQQQLEVQLSNILWPRSTCALHVNDACSDRKGSTSQCQLHTLFNRTGRRAGARLRARDKHSKNTRARGDYGIQRQHCEAIIPIYSLHRIRSCTTYSRQHSELFPQPPNKGATRTSNHPPFRPLFQPPNRLFFLLPPGLWTWAA